MLAKVRPRSGEGKRGYMTNTSLRGDVSKRAGRESRRLVIVSGAGRSGTSTVAGCLTYLGYVVPPPELMPNAANPRGYFEPTWAIGFHKRLLSKASIHTMDARPWAGDLVDSVAASGTFQRQLNARLEQAFEAGDRLVVKDPRAFWARDLWLEAARVAGAQTSFLTMLRHPAEVIGSRDTYYGSKKQGDERVARLIRNLAGWVNATLINERTSRGKTRAFVRYGDLLTDWRSTMSAVDTALGLALPRSELTSSQHEVDEFIDPSLHRVRVTWSDLRLPAAMQDVAQRVWDLVASEDHTGLDLDEAATAELDRAADDYRLLFTEAVALATDEINTRTKQARADSRRKVTQELRQKYEKGEWPPDGPATSSSPAGSVVKATGARWGTLLGPARAKLTRASRRAAALKRDRPGSR